MQFWVDTYGIYVMLLCMENKTCKGCGKTKPLHEYHKQKTSPDGHRPQCKECRKGHTKEKEQNRIRRREHYKANKESENKKSRQYWSENKEKISASRKAKRLLKKQEDR